MRDSPVPESQGLTIRSATPGAFAVLAGALPERFQTSTGVKV